MNCKTVKQSKVIVGSLMQPVHANTLGNIHGGEIMKLMDNAGAIVAMRHSREKVVTARADGLEFRTPVHVGNYVTCSCQLTFVGNTSMEVAITVMIEDLKVESPPIVALTGYFTYVAIDSWGKPIKVPKLEISNEEEAKLFEEGKQRYLKYKELKKNPEN
ncbi:MAG TPA: acyl-CoA thioesterase [Clostridium sp.]|nr:acyl-CoA thioesterase [Clostridium sp.]